MQNLKAVCDWVSTSCQNRCTEGVAARNWREVMVWRGPQVTVDAKPQWVLGWLQGATREGSGANEYTDLALLSPHLLLVLLTSQTHEKPVVNLDQWGSPEKLSSQDIGPARGDRKSIWRGHACYPAWLGLNSNLCLSISCWPWAGYIIYFISPSEEIVTYYHFCSAALVLIPIPIKGDC